MNAPVLPKMAPFLAALKWVTLGLVFLSVSGCSHQGVIPVSISNNSVTARKPAALSTPRVRDDYDGDGKTDPAKFDAATGTVWWLKSSTGSWDGKWLGSENFIYIGASDFDGDGITDPAKYVPSTGTLWWIRSSDGKVDGKWLGSDTFTYIAGADFDGDGKTDPAKFAPSNGMFLWIRSSDGKVDGRWMGSDPSSIQAKVAERYKKLWNLNRIFGDFFAGCSASGGCRTPPRPAISENFPSYLDGQLDGKWLGSGPYEFITGSDFDGDGKTDMAKFVAGTGTVWWMSSSTHSIASKPLGTGTFTYMPASDFDGDGKTDPAKFQRDTGSLKWLKSSTGAWDGVWLGTGTFTVVPGCDFNGDGRTDPARYDAGMHILAWLDVGTGTWTNIDMGTGIYTLVNGQ